LAGDTEMVRPLREAVSGKISVFGSREAAFMTSSSPLYTQSPSVVNGTMLLMGRPNAPHAP
jgi:hypothetical protein